MAGPIYLAAYSYDWDEGLESFPNRAALVEWAADTFEVPEEDDDGAPIVRDSEAFWQAWTESYESGKWKACSFYTIDPATAAIAELQPGGAEQAEAPAPSLPADLDGLGAVMFLAFRAGVAYGKDWDPFREPGETQRDAELDLFCDHFPGFEGAGDRAREEQAKALIREAGGQ